MSTGGMGIVNENRNCVEPFARHCSVRPEVYVENFGRLSPRLGCP